MCLLCIEVSKQLVSPKDFWRNFKEVSEDHMYELLEVVNSTDFEYQEKLANGISELERME